MGVTATIGARRVLLFQELLAPILVGITLTTFVKHKIFKWLVPLVLAAVVLLSTVQLYGYQPLGSNADVLYPGLGLENTPLGYVQKDNSVYQRMILKFTINNVGTGIIACDGVSYNQMTGIANTSFMATHVTRYDPLKTNDISMYYNYFVLHLPGKAGMLQETAQERSSTAVLQDIRNASVVYNNGESYMLANNKIQVTP
jgi:hypothetical protein